MNNWRQILSWQDLDDPEDLTGWLVLCEDKQTAPEPIIFKWYKVVTIDGKEKITGSTGDTEIDALRNYEKGEISSYLKEYLTITPIRKIF